MDRNRLRSSLEEFRGDDRLHAFTARLTAFNLVAACGVARQELKHSDLLAFLLNPAANHGLGDTFLRAFLAEIALQSASLSIADLAKARLPRTRVLRERDRIDLLLVNDDPPFVVLIENKIGAEESHGQLQRYFAQVEDFYPRHSRTAVFLTPEGRAPSHRAYAAVGYAAVVAALDRTEAELPPGYADDLPILLRHYRRFLERHVMTDSEINTLAHAIYVEHRDAIEFIIEQRARRQALIIEHLVGLVRDQPSLGLAHDTASRVAFYCQSWLSSELRREPDKTWATPSKVTFFVDVKHGKDIVLKLVLHEAIGASLTSSLLELARSHATVFVGRQNPTVWAQIHQQVLARAEDVWFATTVPDVLAALSAGWTEYAPRLESIERHVLSVVAPLTPVATPASV